jgi:hypothetical protein
VLLILWCHIKISIGLVTLYFIHSSFFEPTKTLQQKHNLSVGWLYQSWMTNSSCLLPFDIFLAIWFIMTWCGFYFCSVAIYVGSEYLWRVFLNLRKEIWRLNIHFVCKLPLSETSVLKVLDCRVLINLFCTCRHYLVCRWLLLTELLPRAWMRRKDMKWVLDYHIFIVSFFILQDIALEIGRMVLDKKVRSHIFIFLLYLEVYWPSISQRKTFHVCR